MTYIDALILGILQGLTEFLPISSSGHLVIAQRILGIGKHDLAFDMVLHLGTLLSIFTIYWALVRQIFGKLFAQPRAFLQGENGEGHFMRMVVLGSVPTAAIGLLFKDYFEEMFSDMYSLGICFLITAGLLLLTRLRGEVKFSREQLFSLSGSEKVTVGIALLVGVAQGAAIAPSISRSGITIVAGLLLGLPGHIAAIFSFVLSVPAIIGAALLELRHISLENTSLGVLAVGFLVSYLFGLLGLWTIINSVRKGRMEIFSVYLIALGIYILVAWT